MCVLCECQKRKIPLQKNTMLDKSNPLFLPTLSVEMETVLSKLKVILKDVYNSLKS